MNATNTFVKNVDHHLDNIEYHLGHMRRRSTASTPCMQNTAPLKIPKEHAPYRGGESQYTSGSYLPPNLNRRPAATNRPPVSVSSPLHLSQAKRQRGGNGSDEKRRGIVPFAAEAHSSKFAARRRPLRSLSSTSLLLSSSSSTLISSSSSSSRSPSPRPRRGTLASSISSTLTSATLISFSSLEESPAGEIGTRWLQWRRAAYHLLASHYEKCHGVLTSSARQRLQGNYRKKNISHASKKEDYEERRSPTSPSESSDSLDDLIHDEQSLRRYRSTVKIQAAATKDDGASASEQLARGITGEEPTSRHTLDKEVALRERQRKLALQEELAAAARAEVQRKCLRLEEEESNQRGLIEQDEAEELMDVLEAMDADAEEAAQRMARRVEEDCIALANEETTARQALEADALRAAGRLEQGMRLGAREVALRERQRKLALQEELAAAARAEVQRKCLRLEEEESNQRGLIEQDEAEELMDVLEAMDADAEEAAQRMARRVEEDCIALANEETTARQALEADALRAAGRLEQGMRLGAREVALRERQRKLALQEELAAAARAEVQRKCLRLEEEESNQRGLIEQDEAEELMDVLEAMDADAEEAAQRMARRVRNGSVSLEPSLLAYSLLHTDIASKCEDKSVQTPQSVKKVNATQTEIYVSAQMESPEGGDELHCETKSWRELYLLSQLTQTGESELCATVASQTNIGSEVSECGANELNGDVVLGHLTQRRTKCVQTPPPRNASVQASDGTVSAANHGQKSTESRVAVETLDLMFGEQMDPLHTRVESRRRTSSGWQQGDAVLPRNDDDDASPSKNSTHAGVVALSNASSDGCEEEEKEEKGKSADGPVEERPVLEKDSSFSHTPEPQVSPSASRVPSKITIVKDAVSSPSSIIARKKIPSFPRSVPTLPGSLARRRHVELAASSVGAYPYLRESLTNEDEQLAGSSHWSLEAFDFDWSSDAPLYYSAFRDIMRLEARHRRHVERHESLERNEIRWDELSHYRASVRWNDAVAGVVNEARKTTKEEEEEETENGNENEGTPSWGNPRLLAPDSVVASDADASSWQHVADDAVDEKENILPQTDVPQPTDPVKRKSSSTAWCVDMGGGASSGVPPHLRNSPWAPMLTRRTSRSSSKSLLSAMGQVTSQLPRRYRRPPKLNSGNEKVVCPNTQCSDVVCAAPLQRASENALGKKTVAFPGYTQQFERRLVWQQQQQQQQQNGYGLSSHHPPYCRATVSFLESAEWRYQKIYVDQYLYASPRAERRDGTFRKCTDAICEEVGRAYST